MRREDVQQRLREKQEAGVCNYIRYILLTHKAVDGVPTPRKRLCVERNRHRSRAQDPLDEEDVVACVAPCRWRCGSLSLSSPPAARQGHHRDAVAAKLSLSPLDALAASTAYWLPRRLLRRLDGLDDAVHAKARRRHRTSIIGRVEAP